jgi:hypothetical protein
MQDHGAVPHGAMQCNHDAVPHGAIQKGSDCEIFSDPIYFMLKFPKRINYSWRCLASAATMPSIFLLLLFFETENANQYWSQCKAMMESHHRSTKTLHQVSTGRLR